MYSISHKDFSCLYNMLDSIIKIQTYTEKVSDADDFSSNSIAFDASMMNFIIIGEMVDKLSEEFISKNPIELDWFKIKGFRNIIAHNYFGIDAEEVWQIIKHNLPLLRLAIVKILDINKP